MKRKLRLIQLIVLLASCSPILAQQKDFTALRSDSVIQQFDSLFLSEDSLSIFRLIDSLIQMPEIKETSQLAVRLGYNSNVVATSRTIGFNQFGLAPGAAYYHKSGLYADATAYWSPDYSPDFYLTVLSGGYMKTVTTRWSFVTEYSHYFYSATGTGTYNPYTNNVGASNYFDFKPITLRLDYYFYFGEKSAHRILPGVSWTLQKRNWHGLTRFSFFPTINMMVGSERVESDPIFYPDIVKRIRENRTLPDNAKLPLYYTTNKTVFGVMNYSMTLPVSVTIKDWNILISYTYNIPKALPGEDVGLQNGGYASCSVSRYINFKRK